MSDVRAEVDSLLSDRPDLEDSLRSIVDVDSENETWAFDDIPVESGPFGEVVSRGIVEKHEGDYRLADREAVVAALEGNNSTGEEDVTADATTDNSIPDVSLALPDGDRRFVAMLASVFGLVVLFRLFPFGSVFRNGDVVLSSNDPYFYRYFVEQAVTSATGPFDTSVLSSFPEAVSKGEPLLVTVLWWVSELLGGMDAVGGVLAWYPVVAGVISAAFVYGIAVRVTEDYRVGLAAVGLLAVTPVHAFRTGLGFADHHAFDYVWLGLTAWTLVTLVGADVREGRTWGLAGLLGLGVAAQTLAWEAGPLLLIPLGLYVALLCLSAVRAGEPPMESTGPLVTSIGFAALLAHLFHTEFGWHTTVVAYALVLLSVGALAVTGLASLFHRLDLDVRLLAGTEALGLVLGFLVLPAAFPAASTALDRGVEFLLATEGIAETQSIFAGALGSVAAPITLFGLAFFLSVPYLVWASWHVVRVHEPRWLVPTAYAWFFLMLSLLQIRFAGQLALFTSVFAGLGLVHVLAWVDLARIPGPFAEDDDTLSGLLDNAGVSAGGGNGPDDLERRDFLMTVGVVAGAGGLGGLLTPIKHSQVTIDQSMYRAASWMRSYADEHGLEYPQNYVFSRWGRSRVYNYFVNGQSRSYGYALRNFDEFLSSTEPDDWYQRLSDANRDGFVVVPSDAGPTVAEGTVYDHLVEGWGQNTSHFRPLWTDTGGNKKVYAPVLGASVTGPGEPGETVTLSQHADVGTRTLDFEQSIEVNRFGVYEATTALPGMISSNESDVEITGTDVNAGNVVSGFEGRGVAYWSFDEETGDRAYDRVGGYHASTAGTKWSSEGISGGALYFPREKGAYAEAAAPSVSSFSLSLWARPTELNVSEENDYREVIRTDRGNMLIFEQSGSVSFRLPGTNIERLVGESISRDRWNHVVVTFDGATRRLYVDGTQRAEDVVGDATVQIGSRFRFGNSFADDSRHAYAGLLDQVRLFGRSLPPRSVRELYENHAI